MVLNTNRRICESNSSLDNSFTYSESLRPARPSVNSSPKTPSSENVHASAKDSSNSNSVFEKLGHSLRGTNNRRSVFILLVLAYGNFWLAACVSLQAPFFPHEAEKKGASPTQYGLIFAVYELVIFVTSPIFAKMIGWLAPNFLIIAGLFVAGISTVIFGLLDHVGNSTAFVYLAFATRILEGLGAAAFMTASYTVMAVEFSNKIAITFATLETCFGLGLIIGPTVGGALYSLGGYLLPFALLGGFLLVGGLVTVFLFPSTGEVLDGKSGDIIKFLSNGGVILDALAISTSLNLIGFNSATLEPHLRQFNLSPVLVGCMFVISGAVYAVTSPIFGRLCDRGSDPTLLCLIGSILCVIGIAFLGPLPFLHLETSLGYIIFGCVITGIGIAAKLVSAFVHALYSSIRIRGFPDDMTTYGLVSAMFFSSCSIGAFVGPSLGGLLLDKVGYKTGTLFIFFVDIAMAVLLLCYIGWRKFKKLDQQFVGSEREPLVKSRRYSGLPSTSSRI